jgi:hypothetical protein
MSQSVFTPPAKMILAWRRRGLKFFENNAIQWIFVLGIAALLYGRMAEKIR